MNDLTNNLKYESTIRIPDSAGIVVRTCAEILQAKSDLKGKGISLSFSCQFVEIYEEKVSY